MWKKTIWQLQLEMGFFKNGSFYYDMQHYWPIGKWGNKEAT